MHASATNATSEACAAQPMFEECLLVTERSYILQNRLEHATHDSPSSHDQILHARCTPLHCDFSLVDLPPRDLAAYGIRLEPHSMRHSAREEWRVSTPQEETSLGIEARRIHRNDSA